MPNPNRPIRNKTTAQAWELEVLAKKMIQYCYLMEDLTADTLRAKANAGGVDAVRDYLRQRSVQAYYSKREEIELVEPGLMPQAERFFVLVQVRLLSPLNPCGR